MPNYLQPVLNQTKMIPLSFEDQIHPGTFEFALNYIIDNRMDLSAFDINYHNDENGRPAYSPNILLKTILYAYSLGIIHSRNIAEACERDVKFMALSGDTRPHFTTIAHFISSMKDQITSIFRDVIEICHEEGLIGKKMFAIDGCKISSNCSKEWSGTKKQFKRKRKKLEQSLTFLIEKHQESDKENTEWGQKGKEKTAIASLKKKMNKISRFVGTMEDKRGSRNNIILSNITDNESAKMPTSHGMIQGYTGVATADSKHQVIVQAEAHGENQEKSLLKPTIEEIKETFDERDLDKDVLNKVKVITDTGFHSNENIEYLEDEKIDGYLADNNFRKRDPRFKTADSHYKRTGNTRGRHVPRYYKPEDFKYTRGKGSLICPAGKVMEVHLRKHQNTSGLVGKMYRADPSDCKSCKLRPHCVQGKGQGPRTVAKYTHRAPGTPVTPTQRMIKKIDSRKGRFIYSRRMGIVEPVFGNICNTIGLNYFTLRNKVKVDIQWKLFCIVHNLKKVFRYGPGYAFEG